MTTTPNFQPDKTQLGHKDWQRVFDALPDGLIITDRHFNILFINRAYSALSGIDGSALIGKNCHDVFHSELCFTPNCPLSRIRSTSEKLVSENEVHCKNGKQAPWIVTTTAYLDESGAIAGYIESFTDASAFRRVKQALNRSQDRLRKNMGAIIQAMSTTIEKRDPYTAGHQRRVTKLCRAIATRLDFSWERIQGLRMAAAIHDLGKINIPSAI